MNPNNLPPIQDRPNRQLKQYLGDGVYVCIDNRSGRIEITAEDGVEVSNVIYLDLSTANAFLTWLNNLRELSAKQVQEQTPTEPKSDDSNPEYN